MTSKLLALHASAEMAVEVALAYYQSQIAPKLSERFMLSLSASLKFLCDYPKAGSLRLGQQIGRAQIRSWPISHFPYLVIYRESPKQLEVFRVLHQRQDLLRWIQD